jgi:LPS sulfotransferase NodH
MKASTSIQSAKAIVKSPGQLSFETMIVVVGERRSGTTVFRSLLQENGAHSLGEIFHKDEIHLETNYFNFLLKSIATKPASIHPSRQGTVFEEYVDYLSERHCEKAIVIDIKFPALSLIKNRTHGTPEIIRILRKKNAKFLLITRTNKLRCYISEQVALRNKKWHGDFSERSPVKLDVTDALNYVEQSESRAQFLKSWLEGSYYLEISYEAMFSDSFFSDSAVSVASNLLNRPVEASKPIYQKQNPEPIRDLITNFPDLQRIFSTTKHAWMLDDSDHNSI